MAQAFGGHGGEFRGSADYMSGAHGIGGDV
jgi:hypothetical protein